MAVDLRLRFPARPVAAHRQGGFRQALRLFDKICAAILRWHEVRKQRRALLGLSDQMLKDIGISRSDAIREASRPFWDTGSDGWGGWR